MSSSWNAQNYQAQHSYVWEFGEALIELLDPRALAERLRPRMFRDGAWTLDYRRLQVVAVKRA